MARYVLLRINFTSMPKILMFDSNSLIIQRYVAVAPIFAKHSPKGSMGELIRAHSTGEHECHSENQGSCKFDFNNQALLVNARCYNYVLITYYQINATFYRDQNTYNSMLQQKTTQIFHSIFRQVRLLRRYNCSGHCTLGTQHGNCFSVIVLYHDPLAINKRK